MKKHMLKETNSMRRLMNLPLLNEQHEVEEEMVMGVDAPESAGALDKKEEVNEEEGIEDTDKGDEGNVMGATWVPDGELDKTNIDEDSEGEETYNYGEDEGADEHREDEMEDELHHDEEDMAPHDRIKAIEDHLDALKKDMGYDEDHEDRDEKGTNFAEGKRYSKVLNTLTESQYRRLKRFIK